MAGTATEVTRVSLVAATDVTVFTGTRKLYAVYIGASPFGSQGVTVSDSSGTVLLRTLERYGDAYYFGGLIVNGLVVNGVAANSEVTAFHGAEGA